MIPYVQNVSDSVARIMRKYDVPVAMKPYQTLKNVLVCPKDKQNKEEIIKFPVPTVTRLLWVKLEESLESDYNNTGQKWRQKLHGRQ